MGKFLRVVERAVAFPETLFEDILTVLRLRVMECANGFHGNYEAVWDI